MESVNYLDPQCLESGQLPVEELLRDSVYYPACAFDGNWTHFRSADGPLRVVMVQNEGGMPKYVINGGVGSADGYDNLGWSDYEEVDAVQPYYRSVWNECVVHDGGLVLYKRK